MKMLQLHNEKIKIIKYGVLVNLGKKTIQQTIEILEKFVKYVQN